MIVLSRLEWFAGSFLQPLGILYVANALEQQNKEVVILHETGSDKYINKLVSLSEDAEWIGLSVSTGPGLVAAIRVSKRIKHETNCEIVWGGMHPTIFPDVKSLDYVDKVVRGDGEAWITGKPITDLDDFRPSWHLLDIDKYEEFIMITSRGCKYACGFCYNSGPAQRKWIAHSVDKTLEIINSYPGKIELIKLFDDYFFTDEKRAVEITKQLGLPWISTIRANDLTNDLVKKLPHPPDALQVGFESGSPRLLNLINKQISINDIFAAAEVSNRHDIKLLCTLIVDLPTELPVERAATIKLARMLEDEYPNIRCKVKKFRPYPGTALYDLAIDEGIDMPKTTREWREYYELII